MTYTEVKSRYVAEIKIRRVCHTARIGMLHTADLCNRRAVKNRMPVISRHYLLK